MAGLNAAIQRKREQCETCNRIAPSQAREPINLLPLPVYPFQYLSMDAFQLGNQHYLAAVDKFSGWLLIFHIRCYPRSKHIIDSLRSIFTTFGAPEKLYTDGGLPFQASEVECFLSSWKIEHVTSSALYPQSNGRAELAVKSAKRILQDNTAVDGSLNSDKAARALLQYRNTPLQHLGLSPSQVLFHRNLRDGIPTNPVSLKPNKLWLVAAKQREEAFAKRNHALVENYNRGVKDLPIIDIGADVMIQDVQNKKRWNQFGTVVDRVQRKYTIRAHGSGRVITRNRRFIKRVTLGNLPILDMPVAADNIPTPEIPHNAPQSSESTNRHDSSQYQEQPLPPTGNGSTISEPPVPVTPLMARRLRPHNLPGLKE